MLLGEANVERDQIEDYFGVGGHAHAVQLQVNQHLWLALAREERARSSMRCETTAGIPERDQWANFLRNHDEIDSGGSPTKTARTCSRAFGPEARCSCTSAGIRRRLAPMLGGDRRRIELAFACCSTLPGTPVVYYGDEIGMGDDLSLPEREPVRTPMQWSAARTRASRRRRALSSSAPVISRGAFVPGGERRRPAPRPGSLLHFVRRAVRARRELRELGIGDWEAVRVRDPAVLALRYHVDGHELLAVHNLSPQSVRVRGLDADELTDAFANRAYPKPGRSLELDGYGFRWLRPADAIY